MPLAVFDEAARRPSSRTRIAASQIAAVIAPCSARKSIVPDQSARAVSLPQASQPALETAWRLCLSELPTRIAASDFYRGRGFGAAGRAAAQAGADLFVASAGLGLVRADRDIPAYGLTVTGVAGSDAVRGRIVGGFDPASWWRALQKGPYATALDEVFQSEGLVLVALSHPYARLLADDLAALDETCLARLRIVGMGLGPHLPERVRTAALLPYDDRLDHLVPGVRSDFCQRALSHFVGLLTDDRARGSGTTDIQGHRALVDAALGPVRTGTPSQRTRATDEVIVQRISAHLSTGARARSASHLLRAVRDMDGIACEASRFARLYRLVTRTGPKGAAQ